MKADNRKQKPNRDRLSRAGGHLFKNINRVYEKSGIGCPPIRRDPIPDFSATANRF
jgi:hypothetical protein